MKVKIVVAIALLVAVITLAVFGFGIKESAVSNIAKDLPGYDCVGEFCTSCFIEGSNCNCNQHTCKCANMTVDKKECEF